MRLVYRVADTKGKAQFTVLAPGGTVVAAIDTEGEAHGREWLNQLQAALARQKLPPFYVERFVAELSDHITDSLEDAVGAGSGTVTH